MVSLEGIDTWLKYEFLFTGVVIVFVIIYWIAGLFVDFLGSLPLASPKFAFAVVAGGLATILVLIAVTALLN